MEYITQHITVNVWIWANNALLIEGKILFLCLTICPFNLPNILAQTRYFSSKHTLVPSGNTNMRHIPSF